MKRISYILMMSAFVLLGCSQGKKPANAEAQQQATSQTEVAADSVKDGEGKVVYLSTEDFRKRVMDYQAHRQDWVFNGTKPAIVDFYATWCHPCKMMSPIVEQLAKKYAGKIDFYKVDIDKEQDVANAFDIQSIPTFFFVPVKGNPQIQMGAMEKEEFERIITSVLLK